MLANQKIDQEIMITIIYVIIDTICKSLIKTPKQEQKLTDAEVITIAICSALYFQSEHKKAFDNVAFLLVINCIASTEFIEFTSMDFCTRIYFQGRKTGSSFVQNKLMQTLFGLACLFIAIFGDNVFA